MLEEKDQELHSGVGEEKAETTEAPKAPEKTSDVAKKAKPAKKAGAKTTTAKTKKEEAKAKTVDETPDTDEEVAEAEVLAPQVQEPRKEEGEGLEEIDESNAEDAEDEDNHRRHHIPMQDYHAMSMENLVGELQRLIRTEKVQAIRNHVDAIKSEFDLKYQEFIEEKKEEFVSHGGNEADFKYNSVAKRQFNEVYADYREKRNTYYRNLEQNLKANLERRLQIIEELKALVNIEEDINTTYKNFKDLQEQWRNAGAVPRTNYNDVWRTYHHHVEIFYDFLHLNRELRDLDFKYNLEEKEKLVQRAEALAEEPDLNKAFRELQTLHKIWKEDIGPVDKEHREAIWERFSNATKAMHQRRQEHFKDLEKSYEDNLLKKDEIITSITALGQNVAADHKGLQKQIRELEALRTAFFSAGKVPQKVNEETWNRFKTSVRAFNRKKNEYYKNLKKEQQENLDKKRELVELAVSLKDSEDWETVTPQMKKIQQDWKKIGHVPRKYSDRLWKEFKGACNHYFDRMHTQKNKASGEEAENLEKKKACLDKLQEFTPGKSREDDLAKVKSLIEEWRAIGRVPFSKKNIHGKFNKTVEGILKKLGVDPREAELLKYGNKLKEIASTHDDYALRKERTFIRRKIDEGKSEINQLENNLQFFSSASEDNPLVKEVVEKINRHKESLKTWKAKLKKLNILQHTLSREEEEAGSEGEDIEEGQEEA